jgi:hypothetical protein
MTEHNQVCVKVNAFVDEGIRPLVEVLNSIDSVLTWDSCECDSEGMATICLRYGQPNREYITELAVFANRLRHVLDVPKCIHTYMALEWAGVDMIPHIELRLLPSEVEPASRLISEYREHLAHPATETGPPLILREIARSEED